MAKALFYHPPIENNPLITMPLAYLHLATSVKGTTHTIDLLDGRLEENPEKVLVDRLYGYDCLLISVMPGSQILSALKACEEVRKAHRNIPIVWGGTHPSLNPDSTIKSPYVSAIIIGRGEYVLASFLDCINDINAVKNIPNVIVKDAKGTIFKGPKKDNMVESPLVPDISLLSDIEPYICQSRRSSRMIDYISSFGCPHACTFCCEPVLSGSKWSSMDAGTLVNEILNLKEKYNIDAILFQDANFVADRKRLSEFCSLLIENNASIRWISTARVSDIRPFHENGYLRLMKDSGCEMLFMGAEAASEETIKAYKKGICPMDTLGAARLLLEEYDIFPHFSYVISYPVEDMESVKRTLKLHEDVCDLVKAPSGEVGFYNPTAGTAFLKENEERFIMPDQLEGWGNFNFLNQNLYKNPSKELEKLVLRHHINLFKKYPGIENYKIFDIWQEQHLKESYE